MLEWRTPFERIEVGKGRKLRDGDSVAVLSIGHHGNIAADALNALESEGIHAAHYDMRFVKPLDTGLLEEIFSKYDRIITVEDGCIMGGFGSAVAEWMADSGYAARIKRLGIPDSFVHHGKPEELWADCGYDQAGIAHAVREMATVAVRV
jgi:1-deoxy-D-xylulose-5-phosphate synthase